MTGGSLNTTPEPHKEVQHPLTPNDKLLDLDSEDVQQCPLRTGPDDQPCEACQ